MQDWAGFIKEHFSKDVPFIQFMGITVEKTDRGYARITMPMREALGNTYGIVHGGVCAALVDTAIGIALRTLKFKILTVETSTTYLAPAKLTDTLVAEGRLVNAGKKLLHASAEIKTKEGTVVATGRAIYYITGEDDGVYNTDRR